MSRPIAALLRWMLLALLTAWSGAAVAQAGDIGAPVRVCLAPADRALDARTLFHRPGHFDCRTRQSAFGSGSFDVLSAPLSAGVGVRWPAHVRYLSLWQERVTLYALYADGAIARLPLDRHTIGRHLQLGAVIDQRLPFRGVAVTRLLWRVEDAANTRGILVGAHTATPAQGWRSNLIMAAIYAGFGGLCVALLAFNFALWCALRHRFQLAYCVMMVTLLVYAASSSGVLAWIAPDLANNDRVRINYVALAASAAAALAFARSYFEPAVFAGWLGRVSRVISAALLGSSLLFATLAPANARLLDRIYTVAFVILLATFGPVLWRAWRLRSYYFWLFAVAWGAPIVLAMLRTGAKLSLVPWNFWVDNSIILAMILEGLLSSLAIAYRIRLLSRERDEAREQEIAARLLADTDPLTGLDNRRAFLRQAIGRPGEQMLILVDIDHFKRVNDTIGHDGGDEVLRVFARVLRTGMPPGTLIARLGGEEFAIVTTPNAGVIPTDLIDRLRAARMPFDLTVTASIGSCIGPLAREADWKILYRSADRALFEAKAAGRDRARTALGIAA